MLVDVSFFVRGGVWGMQIFFLIGFKVVVFRKGIQELNWVEDVWDDQKGVK